MKIDEYLALFEGVKRPENEILEINLVDLREAADEIVSLRKANTLLLDTMAEQDAEVARLRAALRLALVFLNTLHLLPVTTGEAQKITLAEVSARAREALGE